MRAHTMARHFLEMGKSMSMTVIWDGYTHICACCRCYCWFFGCLFLFSFLSRFVFCLSV